MQDAIVVAGGTPPQLVGKWPASVCRQDHVDEQYEYGNWTHTHLAELCLPIRPNGQAGQSTNRGA
jgi:hypothetical protein